jgi:hypothetical protein
MEIPCVAILNKQKCHFFFIYEITEQEGRTILPGGVGTSGREEEVGRGCGRVNIVNKYFVHMYVKGKMIPVETIPGMGGIKENGGGSEFKYDIFDI